MTKYDEYLKKVKDDLLKSISHLDYSYNKVTHLSGSLDALNEEELETWESFVARFSRVADIFLMKYLKAVVKSGDPGFDGTLRDYLHQGEKLGLIADSQYWLNIRELRNIAAHEYAAENLGHFFLRLRAECPKLLSIKSNLNK